LSNFQDVKKGKKDIKELLQEIKKSKKLYEGGEYLVNDEEKKEEGYQQSSRLGEEEEELLRPWVKTVELPIFEGNDSSWLVSQANQTPEDRLQRYFFAGLQSNTQNQIPQQDPKDLIRNMEITIDVGEGSAMKNQTLCSEQKTKTEVRFVTEKKNMMEEEGYASIKRVKIMGCE